MKNLKTTSSDLQFDDDGCCDIDVWDGTLPDVLASDKVILILG